MREDLQSLSIEALREQWSTAWGIQPHNRIGRVMLEKSLEYKQHERNLTSEQQQRLNQIIAAYKRSPHNFEQSALKPGTRLERTYKGRKHNVLVTKDGYEYNNKDYNSLSLIANQITGSKWNGWLFFGLKKAGVS